MVENHDASCGYSDKENQDLANRYAVVEAHIHAMKVNDDRVVIRARAAHHQKVVQQGRGP